MNAIDLTSGPPSAQRLAQYAHALAAERGVNAGVWDITQLPGARELKGLGALFRQWAPAFNATPRVNPAQDFVADIAAQWGPYSLERRFFQRAISAANALPWPTLLRQEKKNLTRELASQEGNSQLVSLLLACVEELEAAERDKDMVLVVNPDNLEQWRWTEHNLATFLKAHWGLHKAAQDLTAFLEKRAREFTAGEGVVHFGEGAAASHDDPDGE